MAVKNHSLDGKIIKEAKKEFLTYGFSKASLHRMAKNAGITTGALYTRYESKDDLFTSLVKGFIEEVKKMSMPMRDVYMEAKKSGDVKKIIQAIKTEEQIYLDIMFEHYDECQLFFVKSEGSSVGEMVKNMLEYKAKSTTQFVRELSGKNLSSEGLELIMFQQFDYYRQILEKGLSKAKAVACMKTVDMFVEAGWKKIFENALEEEEN